MTFGAQTFVYCFIFLFILIVLGIITVLTGDEPFFTHSHNYSSLDHTHDKNEIDNFDEHLKQAIEKHLKEIKDKHN